MVVLLALFLYVMVLLGPCRKLLLVCLLGNRWGQNSRTKLPGILPGFRKVKMLVGMVPMDLEILENLEKSGN